MHNSSLQEISQGDLVQTALYQALDMMNARQVREFAVPPSTLMGPGAVSRCGQSLVDRGIERVFLMVDGGLHQAGMTQVLLRSLEQSGVAYEIWACPPGEPIDTDVNAAVTQLLQVQCDGVIALGGGSVLDAAKATALQALLTIFIAPLMRRLRSLFLALEAVGLVAFTLIGCMTALEMGHGMLVASVRTFDCQWPLSKSKRSACNAPKKG